MGMLTSVHPTKFDVDSKQSKHFLLNPNTGEKSRLPKQNNEFKTKGQRKKDK